MTNRTTRMLVAAAALCLMPMLADAEQRPYTQGPVTAVTYVKVEPGRFDDYMAYLGGSYRKQMEESVKAGLVLNWHIYSSTPRTPGDPDLILTVTYPNMATLDKNDEFDAVSSRVAGSFTTQNKGFADRGVMRKVLGGDLIREMVLR